MEVNIPRNFIRVHISDQVINVQVRDWCMISSTTCVVYLPAPRSILGWKLYPSVLLSLHSSNLTALILDSLIFYVVRVRHPLKYRTRSLPYFRLHVAGSQFMVVWVSVLVAALVQSPVLGHCVTLYRGHGFVHFSSLFGPFKWLWCGLDSVSFLVSSWRWHTNLITQTCGHISFLPLVVII